MPFPVGQSAVGFGAETTPGTAVAVGLWIPATTMTPAESTPLLLDQSMRGSAAKTYGSQPGVLATSYGLAGNFIPDAVGVPLVGMLGADVITGSAAPYSHAVSLYNGGAFQPPSYTLIDVNGLEANSYPGCMFSDFELTLDPSALGTYTASLVGSAVSTTTTLPAVSYSVLPPVPAWRTAIQVGGAAATYFTNAVITLKRTVTPIVTLQNLQAARNMFAAGDFDVTGKLTAVFESATLRNSYRAGTSTALDFTISNGLTGAAQSSLNLHCSSVYLSKSDIRRDSEYVTLDIEWQATAQPTDAGSSGGQSPLKATLVNAVGAGIYHS